MKRTLRDGYAPCADARCTNEMPGSPSAAAPAAMMLRREIVTAFLHERCPAVFLPPWTTRYAGFDKAQSTVENRKKKR
jgi:hypothetical protein